jgi:hypothetical protein
MQAEGTPWLIEPPSVSIIRHFRDDYVSLSACNLPVPQQIAAQSVTSRE